MEAKSKQRTSTVLPQPTSTGGQSQHQLLHSPPLKTPAAAGSTVAVGVGKRKPSSLANRDQQLPGKPKHTVKFREHGDQEILVVTVEPPSTPTTTVSPRPSSSTCQLPALTTPTSESSDRPGTATSTQHHRGTPYPGKSKTSATGDLRRQEKANTTVEQSQRSQSAARRKAYPSADGQASSVVVADRPGRRQHGQRLAEGCTTLMYACQQGLTEEIVKELREKVSVWVCFFLHVSI